MDEPLLDRYGRPVTIKKIPMSTGRGKFNSNRPKLTSKDSPFEKFADSNGSRAKCVSY